MNKHVGNITIRQWGNNDIDLVRNFVISLAIFEKEPEAVTATVEDYKFAHQSGLIAGHLAFCNEECVGMTLFYETFSTWKGKMLYLEDFIVNEHFRRLGIGQLLFDAYQTEAFARSCTTLKWQVLDWNENAIRFYKRNGADIEDQWWNCRKFLK